MANNRERKYLILLAMVVVGVILYLNISGNNQETVGPKQLYTLEKTGSGVVVDYSALTSRIHAAVDNGLTAANLSVQNVEETKREVPQQKVEGTIRWNARKILIMTDANPESVEQSIKPSLNGAGGEILGTQPDSYQGLAVVRIDVGVQDSLDGDPVTLITDHIYLAAKKPEALPVKPAGSGKMAIIIDDFGYSLEPIPLFAAISRPLTFSVLPYHLYSTEAASQALSSGHQVILHLPMEPLSTAEKMESSAITVDMSDENIQQVVTKAVQSIPGIVGVNNHQGSKATADRRVMRAALAVIKDNNLFFVDSRTSSQSVAYDISREMGLPTGENELFIDNSSSVDAIKAKLRVAAGIALKNGSVTVIGHARLNTAAAVREMIPEIEAMGVTLIFESQLVH